MSWDIEVYEGDQKKPRKGGPGPVLQPVLITGALIPAGWAAHAMWGDAGLASGFAAAGITAVGAVVTGYAHRLTRARSWYAHHMAVASTGAAWTWLAAMPLVDLSWGLFGIELLVGAGFASVSGIHAWAAGQGSREADAPKLPSWEEAAAKVGLTGTKMKVTSVTDHRVTGTVKLPAGRTADELTSKLRQLASAFGVGGNGVRAIEHTDDASQAEVTIVRRDLMRELVPWPGLDPQLVGASIADAPLELGVYEDGEPFTDTLNNRHSLTMGMAGSGKSVYGKCRILQAAARRDVFVVAIDIAKGLQTLGPIEGAIGWPLLRTGANQDAKKQAHAVLAAIKRAVGARADHLGRLGLTQWAPGCGLVFLYVAIEEAAMLADFDEITELAQISRSVGIHLNLSLQRASWGNVDTDARANLGDGVCFGVRDSADAGFCLPDHVTDAGAAPERWQKSRPGAAYAAVESQDPERHPIPVKMYGPPTLDPADENALLAPAAVSLGDQDAKLDDVTRAAFGQAYADYLATRLTQDTPGLPEPTALDNAEPNPATTPAEDDMADELTDEEVFSTPDPDPDLVCGIDDPIEVSPGQDFQLPPKKGTRESAEEVRARMEAQLLTWAEQGHTSFTAAQLGAALNGARGRSWIYAELNRLEEADRVIHEDDGSWSIVVGELAPA
ncbi:plasmid transfer protein TraB [Nocardiopsis rhodophaea]|uniref:Plasmid transfer protein TraB n=1 Tax=Nocardiopsis rhodophaea TaxID=280238 RepID=A0ABN2TMS6_9ACTN